MSQKKVKQQTAPGKPGSPSRWTSSQKTGVGTAPTTRSRAWFTLSHGIVNEVYFPNVDKPNTRDFQFIVTDGKSFFSEEKRDTEHHCENIKIGVAGYRILNKCKKGLYEIEKTVFCNPYSSTLIQKVSFKNLSKRNLKLFLLCAPHIYGYGSKNNAKIQTYKGVKYLSAYRKHIHLAIGCNNPFKKLSCGYVGSSDGWTLLKKDKDLINEYTQALDGNIALCAEIDLETSMGDFEVALSFGTSFDEAAKEAKATFSHNIEHLMKKYIEGWDDIIQKRPSIHFFNSKIKALYDTSVMVLNTHLGKIVPGNVIASLSIPWGSSKGDNDLGGYHLIWPRDLVEIAGGFLASGEPERARLILHFLESVQEEDGHWAQCLWHSGKPYWSNIQMDETALPILLAGVLKKKKELRWFDPWPMVQKATLYLLKNGPITLQDRWEENSGYTPFTLACEISALLVAADFFQEKGLKKEAEYIREVADYWNEQIEKWTFVEKTPLCKKLNIEGYYVRITPQDTWPQKIQNTIEVKNRPPDHTLQPASEIISADALALVRFGLRSANDPKILSTVKAIDYLLKKETQTGPVWKRYNEDGYGEHKNGAPFDKTGIGRGWPLLVGERAHYEIAKGNFKEAKKLILAMAEQSGKNHLLPEQIWDDKDIPKKFLFNGKPTLGAMPLVWAHSEFIKCLLSYESKSIFDCPLAPVKRYQDTKHPAKVHIWKPNHKIRGLPAKKGLRIEVFAPCSFHFYFDQHSKNAQTVQLKSNALGAHYYDFSVSDLKKHQTIHFSFPAHPKIGKRKFKIHLNQNKGAITCN